ncbi:MAG TPA: hypothetical protein VMU71_07185 [Terracidiphilus sp.]|nr:hypothetical protein [Terracidiphilus sp.]
MEAATHPTDLFERYLQAVRKYLPWHRQDDIVAELRANLDAQREEREAELGRPLTEGEMIDWLKELGPPMQMAARYQPPRYLIGPAVFPLYVHVLRLAALWASAAYAVSILMRYILEAQPVSWIAGQLLAYPMFLISLIGWVTVAFVVLELVAERYPDQCPDFLRAASHWSPTCLPQLEKQPPEGGKPRTFSTAVAEFVFQFAVLVWLLLIPAHPSFILGPGAAFLAHSPVRLAPIVVPAFWVLVAFNALQFAWQAYDLFTGNWRFRRVVQKLVYRASGLIPLVILLAAPAHALILLNPSETAHLPAGFDIVAINRYLFYTVAVLVCIGAIQLASDLWKRSPAAERWRSRLVV